MIYQNLKMLQSKNCFFFKNSVEFIQAVIIFLWKLKLYYIIIFICLFKVHFVKVNQLTQLNRIGFALRTMDDSGNEAEISNVAVLDLFLVSPKIIHG